MKDWKACVRTWEKRQTKNEKGMSKVHMHLSSHIQAKELLKKQNKRRTRRFVFRLTKQNIH